MFYRRSKKHNCARHSKIAGVVARMAARIVGGLYSLLLSAVHMKPQHSEEHGAW